jgi:uncharacterized surface protein with fasciclin (FAS1) repeats
MQRSLVKWMAALGTSALLAACGGGGGSDTISPAAPATAANAPAPNTIAQAVTEQADLSSLKAAVAFVDEGSAEKLMPQLEAAGDKTLLAPSNAAFDKLAVDLIGPGKKAADLLTPEYKDDLRDVLRSSLIAGRALQANFVNFGTVIINLNSMPGGTLTTTVGTGTGTGTVTLTTPTTTRTTPTTPATTSTVPTTTPTVPSTTATTPAVPSTTSTTGTSPAGTGTMDPGGSSSFSLTIKVVNGVITITDGQGRVATIRLSDIQTGNGVVHVIDNALMPPRQLLGRSIVAVAQRTPELSSLVSALTFASNDGDLVNRLTQRGSLTVFAPTNAAFNALAAELLGAGKTATDLLVPANKALVRSVLQYHVLGAVVPKIIIPLGKSIDPILDGTDVFKIDQVENRLIITDGRNRKSEITDTDNFARNGVVHVINKVLLPADKDIVDTAIALKPEFSILVEAVVAADLGSALKAAGPLTVLAPTNDAFAALLAELNITKAALLADKPLLTKVLTYHVITGLVLKADIQANRPVKTLQGETLTIDDAFKITDQRGRKSSIVTTDVLAKNGVIHAIDRVILPKP